MPRLQAANNARTVLAQAVGTSDATIYVQDVSKFPTPPFRITVDNEIMEVTTVDAALKAFTVLRAQEGTTATTHSIGAAVENRWTAGTYAELVGQQEFNAHLADKVTHGVGSGYYITKTSRSDQLPSWNDIPDKPSTFPPSSHAHAGSDISSSASGIPGARKIYISTANPSGGSDGDVWFKYV